MRHFPRPGSSRYLGPFVILLAALCLSLPMSAQHLTVLHSFTDNADGRNPVGRLLMDQAGNLYGTTRSGGHGLSSKGTVFKIDTSGHLTVLHAFADKNDGAYPRAGLIMDGRGNLYGTTELGGLHNHGTVFAIDPSGNEKVIYNFKGQPDGDRPYGDLVMDGVGTIFGTTSYGGSHNCGVVFKLFPDNEETVLHAFKGGVDGCNPKAGLAGRSQDPDLYGTTENGGSHGNGTVFAVDGATGSESVVHDFTGDDGNSPVSTLIADSSGDFYGTTMQGGGFEATGTVFKLAPSGDLTVLYAFTTVADGAHPEAGLVMDSTGNLYGTTLQGGSVDGGTVFKIDTSGNETVLHSFTGHPDGRSPYASLILDTQGNLYGTTEIGGAYGFGSVFVLSPQ